MRIRAMTSSGDYQWGNSQLDFLVDSSAAVAQLVRTSLLLWLGEWSFDTSQGMPWLESVLGKHSKENADLAIQNYVLGIDGVIDITEYSSTVNPKGRAFVDVLTIQTQFSENPVQVFDSTEF